MRIDKWHPIGIFAYHKRIMLETTVAIPIIADCVSRLKLPWIFDFSAFQTYAYEDDQDNDASCWQQPN